MVVANYDDNGDNGGDWDEYKRLVLSRIRELREDNQTLSRGMSDFRSEVSDKFAKVESDLARLNVKSGLWGALAGAVLTGGMILLQFVATK